MGRRKKPCFAFGRTFQSQAEGAQNEEIGTEATRQAGSESASHVPESLWLDVRAAKNLTLSSPTVIDEATAVPDFARKSSLFADSDAFLGRCIVFSGTDSLKIHFAGQSGLLGRMTKIHTTRIPFAEWNKLTALPIDEYITNGGILFSSIEEASPYASCAESRDYVLSAICENIQHSLDDQRNGEYGCLLSLREKGELANAIQRAIADENYLFTIQLLTELFKKKILNLFYIIFKNRILNGNH